MGIGMFFNERSQRTVLAVTHHIPQTFLLEAEWRQ